MTLIYDAAESSEFIVRAQEIFAARREINSVDTDLLAPAVKITCGELLDRNWDGVAGEQARLICPAPPPMLKKSCCLRRRDRMRPGVRSACSSPSKDAPIASCLEARSGHRQSRAPVGC